MRLSASQIDNFLSCKRKWAFRSIEKKPEPPRKTTSFGKDLHSRVQNYLTGGAKPGEDVIGQLIKMAMRPGYLPTPSPDLWIEEEFKIPLFDDHFLLGYSDCMSPQPTIVWDHKTTGDAKWVKTEKELADDTQRIVYGYEALLRYPDSVMANGVLSRWLYYIAGSDRTKAKAVKKVEVHHTAAQILHGWDDHILPVANEMLKLKAATTNANDLEPNPDACDAYGGCPYIQWCNVPPAAKFAARINKKVFTKDADCCTNPTKEISMSDVLERIRAKAKLTAPPSAPPEEETASAQAAVINEPPPKASALAELQKRFGAKGVNPPKPEEETAENVKTFRRSELEQKAEKSLAKAEKAGSGKLTVMMDCLFVKQNGSGGRAFWLSDVLAPINKGIGQHWKEVDYGKGAALLATEFDKALEEELWKGDFILMVDSTTNESRAVREVLHHHASVFIRGIA